jgi:integrase
MAHIKPISATSAFVSVREGAPAMRLMASTFVRMSDSSSLSGLNLTWTMHVGIIPAKRMKMESPHIVPLAEQAVEILRALRLLTGNGRLVFPGANDKQKPMSNNTILFALYRLGYKGRMTGHGFRGLASTILHENGFEEEHIELQLAHQKRNKVAAAYNHAKYLSQRVSMMQWWADYLDAQLAKGRKGVNGVNTDQSVIQKTPHRNVSRSFITRPIVKRARAR